MNAVHITPGGSPATDRPTDLAVVGHGYRVRGRQKIYIYKSERKYLHKCKTGGYSAETVTSFTVTRVRLSSPSLSRSVERPPVVIIIYVWCRARRESGISVGQMGYHTYIY